MRKPLLSNRRSFLYASGLTASLYCNPGAFAERLMSTPAQTEGPFYPDHLPLDTDNDLILINDQITPAVGQISWVSGRVLDRHGDPMANVTVEIWQCDASGAYLHSGSDNRNKSDQNFQGYGRFLTGQKGEYLFRTIRPVPYTGRTPHIHYKLKQGNKPLLTTQCYVQGDPGNKRDGIWSRMKSDKHRAALTVPFREIPNSPVKALAARFDLVIGHTPADA